MVIDPGGKLAKDFVDTARNWADYVLLDHWRGGTGMPLPEQDVQAVRGLMGQFDYLLAGGLNADNVANAVSAFDPFGVDVQTGVEKEGSHSKDLTKVSAFVSAVRSVSGPTRKREPIRIPPSERVISIALAPLQLSRVADYVHSLARDADLFHLDHSDGTIAPAFLSDCRDHARIVAERASTTPYDLHALVQIEDVLKLVGTYLESNPLLRVVYLHARQGGFAIHKADAVGRTR